MTATDALLAALDAYSDAARFERLCVDVLARAGYYGIDPQGVGKRDGGKDAIMVDPRSSRLTVFHFSIRKDWERKIEADIERVRSTDLHPSCFVVVSNQAISPAAKDRYKAVIKARLGCAGEIFDRERLRAAVAADDRLQREYFPDLVVRDVVSTLADTLQALVSQGLVLPSVNQSPSIPLVARASAAEAAREVISGRPDRGLALAETLAANLADAAHETAYSLTVLGCLLFERENRNGAISVWMAVLRAAPAHFAAKYNIAVSHEYNGHGRRYGPGFDATSALAWYERALSSAAGADDVVKCLDNMGVVHRHLGDDTTARGYFARALAIAPSDPSALLNHATVAPLSNDERYERLMSLLGTAIDSIVKVNLAALCAEQGRWEDVRDWLGAITDDIVHTPEARRLRARQFVAERRFDEARTAAEELIARDYTDSGAHIVLAYAAHGSGDALVAVAAIEAALLATATPALHVEAARFLRHVSGVHARRSAAEHLRAAIAADPTLDEAHLLLGLLFDAQGMPRAARASYQSAVDVNPSNVEALHNLACLEDDGTETGVLSRASARRALPLYQRAVQVNPDYVPSLVNLGRCLLALDLVSMAQAVLRRALDLSDGPHRSTALVAMGSAFLAAGDTTAAQACWDDVLREDPSHTVALKNAARSRGIIM